MARVIDECMGWPEQTRVLAIGQPTARVLNELGVAASVSPAPDADTVARAVVELVGKGKCMIERPRRLRTTAAMRRLVRQTRPRPAQLVLPAFVGETPR